MTVSSGGLPPSVRPSVPRSLAPSPSLSLSILTAIFQLNLGQPVFIEANDDGGGGDNWTTGTIKSCKAPVKSSPPTNQPTPSFFTGRMPFLSPNQQRQSTEGKNITFHGLATPSSPGGLPTLSLTTNSSWLPWGGLQCLSSAPDASILVI